jgi:hypothetical protein
MKIELIGTDKERDGLHRQHFSIEKDNFGLPINSTVQFVDGLSECDDNEAQYLIDQGRAKQTGLDPKDVKATVDAAKAADKAAADKEEAAKAGK